MKVIFDLANPEDSIRFYQWKKLNVGQLDCSINKVIDSIAFGDGVVARLFYEDNQFKVYSFCEGEFGGGLFFQSKGNTDSMYFVPAACPVMIEWIGDKYYITYTLAHMAGSGGVISLRSPYELVKLRKDSIGNYVRYMSLQKQVNNLHEIIDTVGLTFNLFFNNDIQDCLIYSDFQSTYLGLIADHNIVAIDTLTHFPTHTSSLDARPNQKINDAYCHHFSNSFYGSEGNRGTWNVSGDVFVKLDSIIIGYKVVRLGPEE